MMSKYHFYQALVRTNITASPKNRTAHISRTEKLFSAAVNEFKSGLSDEDSAAFGPCASPGEMVASLDSRIQQEKTKSESLKLLRSLQLIKSFGKAVTPLFDIIGIFVSSHSDLAATVWGAVHLVFLVSWKPFPPCNFI